MISHIINETEADPSIFHYIPDFMNKKEQVELLEYLENTTDFLPSPTFSDDISRLQKWYQMDQKYFCPLWKQRYPHWTSFKMDDTVNQLITKMQSFIDSIPNIKIPQINSCLINNFNSFNCSSL